MSGRKSIRLPVGKGAAGSGAWLAALASEGRAACWLGPLTLGGLPPDERGPYLPVLFLRPSGRWAITLPYWPRHPWAAVEVAVRAADQYHQGPGERRKTHVPEPPREVGSTTLHDHTWAVYMVGRTPAATLPAPPVLLKDAPPAAE